MRKITVVIHNDGKIEIDFSNYYGDECLKELQNILDFLKSIGIDVSDEKIVLKGEYYVRDVSRITQGETR